MSGDQQTLNGRFELHRTEIGGRPTLARFAPGCGRPSADRGASSPSSCSLSRQPAAARAA